MNYDNLNGHFKELIRVEVGHKLAASNPGRPPSDGIRDYVVGVIVLLGEETDLNRAAERLWEMKQANPATACTRESALEAVTMIGDRFSHEVSTLRDLYKMQENGTNITEIVAFAKQRFLGN